MGTFNLEKGGRFNLSKEQPGLTKLRLGLSWDPNRSDTGAKWDLDVSVFACANNAAGEPKIIADEYFLFYNSNTRTQDNKTTFQDTGSAPKKGHPATPCLGMIHLGDNQDGGAEGPDETVLVDLAKLDPRITEISFVVTIHDAGPRKQNFGQVKNSEIALYNDATGELVSKYALEDDFSRETAVQFGSLYKKDGSWLFKAIGQGYNAGLQDFINTYCD